MIIYELLIVLIIFWIMTIILRKDIFAPTSLLCLSYIFAVICAIANIKKWGIRLHYNTVNVIIIGILSFMITSFLYFISPIHRKRKKLSANLEFINIDKYKLIILDCMSIIITIIYSVFFIKAIGGVGAFSNFSVAMESYRSKTAMHGEVLIPSFINFLTKICRAVCYVYTYIIVNNLIKNKNSKDKLKQNNYGLFAIGIISYIPLTLMSGGRYDLIVYILYIIMVFNILFVIENKKRLEVKRIIKIFFIILLVLVGFSSYRGLVGRNSESSGFDYITEYFGGSIEIFDIYMQQKDSSPQKFGEETFNGIHKLLIQLGIENNENSEKKVMDFVIVNNKVIGNVYTGFRKIYHDFGIVGVIMLQSLLALIFNIMYDNCFYKFKENKINIRTIIMGTICFCLILNSYSESFFSNVISFNYIMFFVLLYIIVYFIRKVEVKIK